MREGNTEESWEHADKITSQALIKVKVFRVLDTDRHLVGQVQHSEVLHVKLVNCPVQRK